MGTLFLGVSPYAFPNAADRWHDRHSREHGPEHRLADKYDRFAGSDRNARELVEGLRNDKRIDLSKNGKTTSFTPATGKMGWGNVEHALSLAKSSLADYGIHNPSPEQIKAALNGGSITTKSGRHVVLPGVLKLRASGMGWGQIAHKLDTKLGDVKHGDRKHDHKRAEHKRHDHKHADKRDHHKHVDRHHRDKGHDHKHARHKPEHKNHADWKHHGRPDFHRAKFERPDRPHKVDRPEKFERPQRPEKFERPERHGRK